MLTVSLFILLAAGFGYYSYHTKQSHSLMQSRFNQVIGLRQLVHLLRFHRRQTHEVLSSAGLDTLIQQPLNESMAIQSLQRALLNQAEKAHKPMYRILMKRLSVLIDEWPRYSIQRNQAVHGKTIRHVMYLIDDTVTQSLLTADKEQLFKRYQSVWPITLNAIDSLSRFRNTINHYTPGNIAIKREVTLHTKILRRRLNQMTLSSSEPVPPIIIESLFEQFDSIDLNNPDSAETKSQLYEFSLLLSDTLFNLFDLVLCDIGKEISIRLPDLPVTQNNNIIKLVGP